MENISPRALHRANSHRYQKTNQSFRSIEGSIACLVYPELRWEKRLLATPLASLRTKGRHAFSRAVLWQEGETEMLPLWMTNLKPLQRPKAAWVPLLGGGERKARGPQASPSSAAWRWSLPQTPSSPMAEPKSVTQRDGAMAFHGIKYYTWSFICLCSELPSLLK